MKDVIMIIDDDDDMRDFLTGFLSRDYIIICAADGKEALGLLEKQYVSLIVSDVMMPRIDGYELCDKIKSDLAWCHIPLLLLTAKTTLQSKIKGLELGADAYVEKPFSP